MRFGLWARLGLLGLVLASTATLVVARPASAQPPDPSISKSFGATSIPLGGTTSLTFTVAANDLGITEGVLVDNLPAGLVVATPNGLNPASGLCHADPTLDTGFVTADPGSSQVTLAGIGLNPGESCSFSVNVTGTTAGVKNNTTNPLFSDENISGPTSNTATLTVIGPPTISKSFGAASIPLAGTTPLSFTVANPNTTTALTGVGFSDTLPAGLVVGTPNGLTSSCGGTSTATAGSGSVSLTGATLAASGSCTFALNVTGTTLGVKLNSVQVFSTEGGTGNSASATVTVGDPPSIAKAFGAASIPLNGTTSLAFTITNPNAASLSGVGFSDTLPAGLVVATPNGLTSSCGGTSTATAGSGTVSLTGATLPASGSCTFALNVTGITPGVKNNTTTAVTSLVGPGNSASATITVLAPVVSPLTVAPSFTG